MSAPAFLTDIPPRRGPAVVETHDLAIASACQERPGHWTRFLRTRGHAEAEAARRRIKRGGGAWHGGAQAWLVSIRKITEPPEGAHDNGASWDVYVAYAPLGWVDR